MPNAVVCMGVSMRLTELRALDLQQQGFTRCKPSATLSLDRTSFNGRFPLCGYELKTESWLSSYIAMPEETMNVYVTLRRPLAQFPHGSCGWRGLDERFPYLLPAQHHRSIRSTPCLRESGCPLLWTWRGNTTRQVRLETRLHDEQNREKLYVRTVCWGAFPEHFFSAPRRIRPCHSRVKHGKPLNSFPGSTVGGPLP